MAFIGVFNRDVQGLNLPSPFKIYRKKRKEKKEKNSQHKQLPQV
jgi:uncharacterized protein (DUF697 family)